MTTAFATLGLCPVLVQTVTALGYTQPTPIQARAIPELLAGRDVLGQAQTGTGKTAAFALPMLQLLAMQATGVQGLVLDLLRQGALDLGAVRYLVLDEADAMLQMGFIEDVEALLRATPPTRQTALFSATLPPAIRHLAARYMRDPLTVAIDEARTVPQTTQRYYLLQEPSKVAALTLLLEAEEVKSALVFTRTMVGAAELAETLAARGYAAEALHG